MKVTLFIPCLTDALYPETGMNMVRILERLGIAVEYPKEQTCCGQPAFNTGYHREARQLAERFLRLLDGAEYVVAPSGSCVTMVKHFYGTLLGLGNDAQRIVEELRGRIHEFSSFLVDVLRVEDVGAAFPRRVTVHDSCHALRELHVKRQVRTLLQNVRGLELIEMDEAEVCCGFGGTFSIKYPNLSAAITERKIEAIVRSAADVVTGVDSSCLMQIQGMLTRKSSTVRTMHLADILGNDAREESVEKKRGVSE